MYRSILSAFAVAMLMALQFAVSSPAHAAGGLASYYGNDFAGRPTASGERFNPGAYTAASLTLPFGTMVRVTNRRTGRSVTVRINDRGPYVGGRVIDLSLAAASAIGLTGAGVGAVDLQVVGSEGVQVASNERHRHQKSVRVASLAPRRHHASVRVASVHIRTKQVALGLVHNRHRHNTTDVATSSANSGEDN